MSQRAAASRLGVGCLVGFLALGGSSAQAQRGILRAFVVDSAGFPIPGAEVTIFSLGRSVRSDSAGRLVLAALPQGSIDIAIRHMGYHAQSQRVQITSAPYDSIKVTLFEQATSLDEVNISAIGRHPFFQGFDQRRAQGVGTFITREQIDARNTLTPSDLFRSIPQVRLVRSGSGMGIRFPTNTFVRGRGSDLCMPMIWLDGQRATGMEIDDLRATDIEAIEMYRGASTTPPQFA